MKNCRKVKSLVEYSEVQNVSDTAFGDGEKIGIEKGEKIGIEKGKVEEKHTIAKNMLAKGFDLATISELTGLTAVEIENLKNEEN